MVDQTLETLLEKVQAALGDAICATRIALGEVTIEVQHADYFDAMQKLHQSPGLQFEQLMDLCGVDYLSYKEELDEPWQKPRFCVVAHLLSVSLNQRVRVKVFCPDDAFPLVPTVTSIWSSANWFEREAFDLFGIVFDGHPDLRRILTDYGFIGHPFRKDFPLSGYVQMRYDPELQRVVYEPVNVEARDITPRIIREEGYGTQA